MKETRYIDINVRSNASKVSKKANKDVKSMGKSAKTAGAVGTTAMTGFGASLKGVAVSASAATGGIRAMTMALISSGVGAIVVVLGTLIASMMAITNRSKEFAVAQSNLKAVLQGSSDEMNALSRNAKDLGASTMFTATQVTGMQLELGKLGFTTTEILDATAGALDLAASSGADLAESAEVAAGTLNGFGLDASETNRVVDVMAKSFTSSALDMNKFRESMKLVAPIAKAVDASIEEASAALSILADRGVAGSMAGTQLRRVMSDLAVKTGKSFQESLKVTAEMLDGATTNADKLAIAKKLVGDRAKGSLIALAENREELAKLTGVYENAEGAAANMAGIRMDNLTGDTKILASAWEGLMLSIEDGDGVMSGIARGAVQMLTRGITNLTNMSKFLGFMFTDVLAGMKLSMNSTGDFLGGAFSKLGNQIKIFANKALLVLADIPIIGSGLDKEKIRQNIEEAVDAIKEAELRMQEGREGFRAAQAMSETRYIRFLNDQKQKELERAEKKRRETIKETEEGISEDAKAELKVREAKIKALKASLKKEQEDADADDEIKKLELKKERRIREVEALKLDKNIERQLLNQIDDLYDSQIDEAKEEKKTKDAESFAAFMEKQFNIMDQDALKKMKLDEDIAKFKIGTINKGLDAAIFAAGEESKIGKALYVIKQALGIKTLIDDAKNALKKAALNAAESTGEIAKGTAKATATLNPFIIASYAASAVGVIASIASAFSKSKAAVADVGGVSAGGATISAPKAPSFNLIGNASAGENKIASAIETKNNVPLKAYVVSGEVSSAQELDRNVENTASIG